MADERDDLKDVADQARDTADAVRDLVGELARLDGQHARATVDVELGAVPDAGEAVENQSRPARVRSAYQPDRQPTYPEPIAPPSTIQELIRRQPILGPVVRPIPPAVQAPPPAFQPPPRAVQPVSLPPAAPPLLSPLTPPAIASALRGPTTKQDVPELAELPGRPEPVRQPMGDPRQLRELAAMLSAIGGTGAARLGPRDVAALQPHLEQMAAGGRPVDIGMVQQLIRQHMAGKLQVQSPGPLPVAAAGPVPVQPVGAIPVQRHGPIPVAMPGALEVRQPGPAPTGGPPGPGQPTQPRQPGPRGPVDVRVLNWPAGLGQPMPERMQMAPTAAAAAPRERLDLSPLVHIAGMFGGIPGAIASMGYTALQGMRYNAPGQPRGATPAEQAGSGGTITGNPIVEELKRLGLTFDRGMKQLGQDFRTAVSQLGPSGSRTMSQPAWNQPRPPGAFPGPLHATGGPAAGVAEIAYRPGTTAMPPVRFQPPAAASATAAPIEGGTAGGGAGMAGMTAMLSRIGGYLAAAAVIARQGLAAAERAGANYANPGKTAAEKARDTLPGMVSHYDPTGLATNLTLGVGKLLGHYEDIPFRPPGYRPLQPTKLQSVIDAELAEHQLSVNVQKTRALGQSDLAAHLAPMQQMGASAAAVVKGFTTIRPAIPPLPDMVREPWMYQRWIQESQAERQKAQAQRETAGARAGLGVAVTQETQFVAERDRLQQQQQRLKLEHAVASTSWDPNMIEIAKRKEMELISVTEQLAAANDRVSQAQERRRQAGLELAGRESGERQAEISKLRLQQQFAQEDAARSRTTHEGVGFLHPAQRTFARQAIEQAQKFGLEGLVPEQRDLIRQVGGDRFLSKLAVDAADKDPETKRIQQLLGNLGLREAEKRELELHNKVQLAVEVDLKGQAQARADTLSKEQLAQVHQAIWEKIQQHAELMKQQQLQQWGNQK